MTQNIFEFDVVVVGGGPAGLAAACAASESKTRVALVDESPWLGGQIWRGHESANLKGNSPAALWLERFRNSGAALLDRTAVVAAPRPGLLLAEREEGPRQIRWKQLVLATGARELFLPFPGWTLPGTMGPGGLQALAKHGWPIEGKRVVVAGTGPLLLAVADGLKKYGANVVAIYEQASRGSVSRFGLRLLAHWGKLWQAVKLRGGTLGIPYQCGVWPVAAEGNAAVERVTFTDGKTSWSEECDYLACGFGMTPNVELPLALGCELKDDFVWVDNWQATSVPNVYCAGEPTGIGGADCALVEGQIAGYAATGNHTKAEALVDSRNSWHSFRCSLAAAFALRAELKTLATEETLVCRCEDVSLGRIRQFSGWREAKLQTRCGMGACQGRVCGAAVKFLFGWHADSVRPPILPARISSLVSQPASILEGERKGAEPVVYTASPPKK
jgi:NADPH-dependent 2,4-dienoyl-CoA reductase/sulfur reductase-like enzyme